MIPVSDAWKDVQQRFLLPETFVEIDCVISEEGAQESATISGTNEAEYSDVSGVLDDVPKSHKYVTNELNFWSLDGIRKILPDAEPYGDTGYVSNIASTGSVVLTFPEIRTAASSGLTITWSSAYGEYPTVFTVVAKNGNTVVAEQTVTDNRDQVCSVFMTLQDYDSIEVTVQDWVLPYRRVRIEKIVIGHVLTLTKKDILSFSCEQHGDLLSGELPKYSIEFTLDNTDGRWNPNNPSGMEQYLSERQRLTVRYGLDVNGVTEWISGGTFYLSEWNTPSNGLEARFVARDVFEFLMGDVSGVSIYGNLAGLVTWAVGVSLPDGASVVVDPSLNSSPGRSPTVNGSPAEMIQRCANAAQCVLRYDRGGTLHIEPLDKTLTDYRIPLSLAYAYPEITLSKPLKEVAVTYGEGDPFKLSVNPSGETQTVTNDYIYNAEYAANVASWVRDVLNPRRTVSGEFRADPRLDLFDIVTVEDKYGEAMTVAITSIKYTFNGAFRGSFTGRVVEGVT